jgi:erythromycin esterase-like protein
MKNMAVAARQVAITLRQPQDLDELARKLSTRRIVMLGEASHGTHEFYDLRRQISEILIADYGFRLIAVEGDWPPCARLNEYIQGEGPANVVTALSAFRRWPTWMWANTETMTLAENLRRHNARVAPRRRAGFFGLDVYSLFESIDEVLRQLHTFDPQLARALRARYACFEPFEKDEKAYARTLLQMPAGCRESAVESLQMLLGVRMDQIGDTLFDAQQNARIVANAENYYRAMVHGDEDSWNVRDAHMLETLQALLARHGPDAKAIVWAHNTHIGDYRATDMVERGQVNIGGLAREVWGDDQVALVGFGTFAGDVIAAHAWGGAMERKPVPPAPEGSVEHALHLAAQELQCTTFLLDFTTLSDPERVFAQVRGHRAIGVVYNPAFERFGNYVPTSLSQRYDAFVFVDQTSALTPLHPRVDRSEMPETWPQGV